MPSLYISLLLLAALSLTSASPRISTGGAARSESGLVAERSGKRLRKRANTFDLNKSWDNEVIFDGNAGILDQLLPPDNMVPPVTVTCVRCCTSGAITASINDDDIIDPTFRIDMKDMSAKIDLDVVANGASTFSIPLLPSPANFLSSVVRGIDASLGFSIDLVFDVAAELDVRGGFAVEFPDDAFFEVSLFGGAMESMLFDGIKTQSLPFSINLNGSQTLQVDLQLKAEVGLTLGDNVPFIDFPFSGGASVGAYVNLVEFIAELESTPECQLQLASEANLNLGVFGGLELDVGKLDIGAVPTVSTTLLSAAIGTLCIVPTGLPLLPKPAPVVTTQQCQVAAVPTRASSGYRPGVTASGAQITGHSAGSAYAMPTAALGTTTVVTATACAVALINCPEDKAYTFEITSTVCPQATSTPGVCFAAGNATAVVPLKSLETPITASLPPLASATGCPAANGTTTRQQTATGTAGPVAKTSQLPGPSGMGGIFGGVPPSANMRNGTAVATGGFFTPTGAPSAAPNNATRPPVTVSAGDRVLERRWGLCSMSLALVAATFVFAL